MLIKVLMQSLTVFTDNVNTADRDMEENHMVLPWADDEPIPQPREQDPNADDSREGHDLDCACMDRMDCGRLFARHDWLCSCGYRDEKG